MKRISLFFAHMVLIIFSGCDNKQAKVDSLKAQSEPLQKRYQADCIDSVMGVQGADSALKGAPAKAPSPQDEAAHNRSVLKNSAR